MAAPSGTSWASIINDKGRIGLYVGISNTNTTTTVTIQAWFWSKFGCSDKNNDLYFNNDASSATTLIGPVTIRHSVSSGSGWSTSNQTKLLERTYSYARSSNAQTKYCAVNLKGIDAVGAQMTHSVSYTVPALPSYTVSYNANGGTGAPSKQTKWYGVNLTLSSTKPSRSHYSFLGWSTSSSATSASYSAGGSYTDNASATLYAVWKGNTYTITYNANGGTGAPSKQSYTYASSGSVNLSSTEPTRTNYNFLGWARSSSATSAEYSAGQAWAKSNGANYTLYAVWELAYTAPRITNVVVERANSSGTHADDGTYFNVSFDWETDKTVSSVSIYWGSNTETISASGTSGTVTSNALGSGSISTESSYVVTITVADSTGSSSTTRTIPAMAYTIDFLSGGKGVSIGKPANKEGFEVDMTSTFNKASYFNSSIYDRFGIDVANGQAAYTGDGIDPNTTLFPQILTDVNVPYDGFWYIYSMFYNGRTTSSMRGQFAIPYTQNDSAYIRHYYRGSWSSWVRLAADAGSSVNASFENPMYAKNTNNYLGQFRFNTHWMGIYSDTTYATRYGWIGYNNSFTNMCLVNETGNLELNIRDSTYRIVFVADATDGTNASLRAAPTGKINLGHSSYKWKTVYAASSTISTSDRTKKKDFAEFDEKYENLFFDLKPTLYRFIDNNSNRIHSGFIAQDVEESLEENGLTALDFAGFCKDKAIVVEKDENGEDVEINKLDENGNQVYDYSLRYEEFIALNTHMLQKAYAKIDEQQAQIDSLQAQIDELKQLLTSK